MSLFIHINFLNMKSGLCPSSKEINFANRYLSVCMSMQNNFHVSQHLLK